MQNEIMQQRKQAMEQYLRLIDSLDLDNLPARLDDKTYYQIKNILNQPLPPAPPCDDRHFAQCLRVMLAVLPKRSQDELSGELFVAAYQRKLGHLSNDQISHIADRAMEKCHWFPTIAECLEFMETYWRNDAQTALRSRLREIETKESRARTLDLLAERRKAMTQEDINGLDDALCRIGLRKGWLILGPDGKPILNPDDDCDGIEF